MTFHLTPDMLEAAYELLRTTPPFKRWKLPHGDEVEFVVSNSIWIFGSCTVIGRKMPEIVISAHRVGTCRRLLEVMAHEMLHVHEDLNCRGRTDIVHSARFKRLARRICDYHSFDAKDFL